MSIKNLFPDRAVLYPAELAKAAGCTTWCVQRDIREGHLKAVLVGSRERRAVPIEDAERWLLGSQYSRSDQHPSKGATQ